MKTKTLKPQAYSIEVADLWSDPLDLYHSDHTPPGYMFVIPMLYIRHPLFTAHFSLN